ncbi:MAG: hypothetical protein QXK37_03610 [Candidatus Woesearchaeota archaeon]
MFKRAQAAMEFLMTYGWAILVVLAAIGALAYFGVLSPANFMPDKCDIPAGLDCIEKPVISSATGEVKFKVTNNMGTNITIVSISGGSQGDCAGATNDEDIADIQLEDGETTVITYTPPAASFSQGQRIKCRFSINYYQGTGGILHPIAAYIVGKATPI